MIWKKLDGSLLHRDIKKEVELRLIEELGKGHEMKVCIGTDSQVYQDEVEFGTAIVFRRVGKGAFMYVSKSREKDRYTVKERMLLEVAKSIEVAYDVCSVLEYYDIPMEIHVDINTSPMYKSNEAMKEALGYIMGMGYDYKLKPDSYASSSAANFIVN